MPIITFSTVICNLQAQSLELGHFFLSSPERLCPPVLELCCFFLLELLQAELNWCLKFEKALGILGEFGTDFGLKLRIAPVLTVQ